MKNFIAIASILLLTACATQQKVTPDQKIAADEGILLTNLHCAETVFTASIYKSGKELSLFTVPLTESEKILHCNKGYHTIVLPDGDYFLSSIVVSPRRILFNHTENRHIPEAQTLKFSVQRNKINYIGDINLSTGEFPESVGRYLLGTTDVAVNSQVENKKNAANNYLQSEQSHLLKNYSLVTSLAKK